MAFLEPKPGPGLRPPTSNQKNHGRVVNPPRYAELGGLTDAAKALTPNQMRIAKPGGGAK